MTASGKSRRPRLASYSLKRLHVGAVLISTGGDLVLEQCFESDDGNGAAVQLKARVSGHCLIEGDPGCAVQDVDPARRQPDLKDSVVSREVRRGDLDGVQGCTKSREGLVDARRVRGISAHQHVQILGGAGMSVKRHGVASHHHECGPCVMELDEEVAKVLR